MSIEVPSTEPGKSMILTEINEKDETSQMSWASWEDDGTDIPIYNRHLYCAGAEEAKIFIEQRDDKPSNHFNSKLEDYWLFYVHLNHAEMEIALGGETPVLVTSNPSFRNFSATENDHVTYKNDYGKIFKVSYM
ncbi:hypothetical protein N7532_003505 [Penicillium argentinense]|uniref:Uncharacterized protein n=1 Tax=Penicillium argentinense TaxID=1131581 RepID=A0A9W9KEL0_9EURO|nr:uncharacterized protein N7532_003505 [Penicillium argentinense]KAJ5102976.1 hypothetical protein N7532_003505 [Penicillium argentinense]